MRQRTPAETSSWKPRVDSLTQKRWWRHLPEINSMRLLILLLIVSLPAGFATGHPQETTRQDEHFEIALYEGFPVESLPVEFRKELKPEKPLLISPVAEDGKF